MRVHEFILFMAFELLCCMYDFVDTITQENCKKYVGVQSWKAMHLPTLDIRVEQKGNRAMKWKIHISFKTVLVPVSPC